MPKIKHTDKYPYQEAQHISFSGKAETVITADEALRGGKPIPLKTVVDKAVELSSTVKRVFVYRRTGGDVPMTKIDYDIEKVGGF